MRRYAPSPRQIEQPADQSLALQARAMSRAKHLKKKVEEALRHAEEYGWRIGVGGSHAWGGRITIPSAAAESFASRAFGARREVHGTTRLS